MEPQEKKHKLLKPLLIILAGIVLVGATGFSVWCWQQQELQKQKTEAATKVSGSKSTSQEKPTADSSVLPKDFKSITLNEVGISYPATWGEPLISTTQEDFSSNGPNISFAGQNANFNDYKMMLNVINLSSYQTYAQKKSDSLGGNILLLKDVYQKRKIEPEEFYAKHTHLPPVNAGESSFNPRYIESETGDWRGYWYIANIGQSVTGEIKFVAALYNQDKTKITSIEQKLVSKKTDEFNERILVESENNTYGMPIRQQIDEYMRSAYLTDGEIKQTIDNESLLTVKYLK